MELIRTIIGAGRNWPDFSVVPHLYYPLSLILSTLRDVYRMCVVIVLGKFVLVMVINPSLTEIYRATISPAGLFSTKGARFNRFERRR